MLKDENQKDKNPKSEERKNKKTKGAETKSDESTSVCAEDIAKLHTAITELILDLKGEGTVDLLAKRINVSRNRLSKIFKPYKKQQKGEVVLSSSETDSKPQKLYWKLDTLVVIAQNLDIHVSDIILAAEDVLAGLPPWFQYQIPQGASSQYKLMLVFLEVMGYHKNVLSDRLGLIGRRRSRQYNHSDALWEEDITDMNRRIARVIADSSLNGLVSSYDSQEISSKDAYKLLKRALEKVKLDLHVESMTPSTLLRRAEGKLIESIEQEYQGWLSKKGNIH